MTGLEGNRISICPERFRIASPRVSIHRGADEVLNLKGQIDSLLPEGPVIICFIIPCYPKKKMIILIGSLLVLTWV